MHSQQQLNQLIDDERQKMLDAGKPPRIVLLGFSQGAFPFSRLLFFRRESSS